MDAIIQKTRELGQLLLESDECKSMIEAQNEVMNDPEASALFEKLNICKEKIQDLLIEENPDTEQLKRLSEELDAYQERLGEIEVVQRMTAAQTDFSRRIEQVNATLRFIITGEVDAADDCGGNCAHCPGCH